MRHGALLVLTSLLATPVVSGDLPEQNVLARTETGLPTAPSMPRDPTPPVLGCDTRCVSGS